MAALAATAVFVTIMSVAAALVPASVVPFAPNVASWLYLINPIVAAFTCLSASRIALGGYRRFWILMTLSMAIWPVGQLLYLILNPLGLYSFPSWIEIPLVVSNLLTVAALLSYPRDGALSVTRRLLDGLMTATAVTVVIWHLWLLPLLQDSTTHSDLASIAGLYFPAISTIQLTIGLIIWNEALPGHRRPLGVVILGFAFLAGGGIWYAQMRSSGTTAMTGFALNMTGNLCTALAPLLVRHAVPAPARRETRSKRVSLAPYAPTAVALGLMTYYFIDRSAGILDLIATVTIVVLLLARQYLTLVYNGQLAEQVAQSERNMRHHALHDRLTGLANRTLFRERLERALEDEHGSESTSVSVLFIDLDGFKTVNDTMGHRVGDELLVAFSARLRSQLRHSDTVARLGGDEFAVLLDGAVQDPISLSQRIVDRSETPYSIDGESITFTVSVGIATTAADEDPVSADQILARADTAMIRAKRDGKGRVVEYTTGMTLIEADDRRLRHSLTEGLADGHLTVALQPIVNIVTGEQIGDEALLRLPHDAAFADPLLVLSAATRAGILPALTGAVIERACARAAQPAQDDLGKRDLYINIQPPEIGTAELNAALAVAFGPGRLNSRQLVLDIAETSLPDDTSSLIDGMVALRRLGVRIALDNFGAGALSLGRLGELPVDIIKIAPTLIEQIERSPRSQVVLASILYMAEHLGVVVVAKGVERPTQLTELQRLGFTFAQGHLLGSPDIGPTTWRTSRYNSENSTTEPTGSP
jgi:diguanylate cyclase (GGDEF)-like protein